MTRAWGTIGALAVLAGATLVSGSARAALTGAEQKCLDGYNNGLRLVAQQAGKDYRSCIKEAGKGHEPNPDLCVTNDTPGKVAGKAGKVSALYDPSTGKCTGVEPIQQGATSGNAAMINSSQDLVREIFGDPLTGVVNPGKPEAKCQDKAYKRAEQLFTEKLKAFRMCKKEGMKDGSITTSIELQAACMQHPQPFGIPDPSGKQAGKAQKLIDDINSNCGAPVVIATQFPGDCSGTATTAALGECIETLVECKVCNAINEADGMDTNCDIFDDGLANGSCCAAGGQHVGGFCWYLGDTGDSCDTTCTSRGETYSEATRTFAGDLGTANNCLAVLNALGIPGPIDFPNDTVCVGGYGCMKDVLNNLTARCTNPTFPTTAGAAYLGVARRACACQ